MNVGVGVGGESVRVWGVWGQRESVGVVGVGVWVCRRVGMGVK